MARRISDMELYERARYLSITPGNWTDDVMPKDVDVALAEAKSYVAALRAYRQQLVKDRKRSKA